LFQLPSLETQETWYPTLRKTVWVLSQLRDFVNPAIFEDIALEAITLCKESLVMASELIRSRSGSQSQEKEKDGENLEEERDAALDARLFLVRHLLILKEMTHGLNSGIDQQQQRRGADFGGVTETLASILNRTTSLLPDALFASLGMPRGDGNWGDAKHGIDHELKQACEDIIFFCSEPICSPLRAWVDRVRSHNTAALRDQQQQQRSTTPISTTAHLSFPPSAAEKLHMDFHQACERDLRTDVARLRLYLEDDRTVGVLVGHAVDRIVDEYGLFREVVWNLYGGGREDGGQGKRVREVVFGTSRLRESLRGVCEEGASEY